MHHATITAQLRGRLGSGVEVEVQSSASTSARSSSATRCP